MKISILNKISLVTVNSLLLITTAFAQNNNLQDINLDGKIEMLAFGDSITRGVGDFYSPGEEAPAILPSPPSEAGYPLRMESLLGISVQNKGIRGEFLSEAGVYRFSSTVSASNADYIILSEGANDVFVSASSQTLRRDMQAMINMAKVMGREPIIATIPTPCCGHAGSAPYIDSYNLAYKDLAALNEIKMADVSRAFSQTCTGEECYLFNLPEGLHPNSKGYDAMAQTIIAAIYGIDLLGPGGGTLLAQALGIPPTSIAVTSLPETTTTNSSN